MGAVGGGPLLRALRPADRPAGREPPPG